MTDKQLRHKTVAVIYDPRHGFLLWNNKRWGGYAFPMKHMEDGDDPEQTALQAVSDRGYFFPTIRRKTHGPLESLATQAVLLDLAYDGDVQASYCGEVPHQRPGTRYGASDRRYRFYLVCVCFPDVDLIESASPLGKPLEVRQAAKAAAGKTFGARGYADWFTVDAIKTRNDVSPDAKAVLLDAIDCAKKCQQRQ